MKENNDPSSLGNPFDHRQSLIHGRQCDCHQCSPLPNPNSARSPASDKRSGTIVNTKQRR